MVIKVPCRQRGHAKITEQTLGVGLTVLESCCALRHKSEAWHLEGVITINTSCLPQSFPSGASLWFIGGSSPHFHEQQRISREREGSGRLQFPTSFVQHSWCFSSPDAEVWLQGSSSHAVSFLSKESVRDLILLETFTLRAHLCHPNSCQASIRVFRRGFPYFSVFPLSSAEQRRPDCVCQSCNHDRLVSLLLIFKVGCFTLRMDVICFKANPWGFILLSKV